MFTPYIIALVAGYILGALPFGYLVARAKGVNIFEVGSKNPGATNVRRVLGKGPGNVVFSLDALKGAVATGWPLVALHFLGSGILATPDSVLGCQVLGLVGSLLGHSFSCFTRFRGGKGVATACGGFLVLMPLGTLIAAAIWAAAFYSMRYVSLASILAAFSLPVSAWLFHQPRLVIGIATLVACFVILRHRANITRLLNGTESKFVRKTEPGK